MIDLYPYTNFHELNLDWIVETMKKLAADWAQVETEWKSLRDYVENFFSSPAFEQTVTQSIMDLFDKGYFDDLFQGTIATPATIQAIVNAYATNRRHLTFVKFDFDMSVPLTIPDGADIDFRNSTLGRAPGTIHDVVQITGSNVIIEGLTVNGRAKRDNLSNVTASDRFGGIVVTGDNVNLRNVNVHETVNNELTYAVFLDNCNSCTIDGMQVNNNVGSAIGINHGGKHSLRNISGLNNAGSVITGAGYNILHISNVYADGNSYSAVSINGTDVRAESIYAINSGYSGINIGHSDAENHAEDVVLINAISKNNAYEGITITNGTNIYISNTVIIDNARNGVQITTGDNINFTDTFIHANTISSGYNGFKANSGCSVSIINLTTDSLALDATEYSVHKANITANCTFANGCRGSMFDVVCGSFIAASGVHNFYDVTYSSITLYSNAAVQYNGGVSVPITLNDDCYGYATMLYFRGYATIYGHITTNTSPTTTAFTLTTGIPNIVVGSDGITISSAGVATITTGEHYFTLTYPCKLV